MNFRFAASAAVLASLSACASIPDAVTPAASHRVEVQIIALNDFHGNLETPASPTSYSDGDEAKRERLGGAARMGAALQRLREGQAHSVTVAAGDLIGASPFASAHFLDEPAIMVLGAMGLEIASVGNHEFDRGVPELLRMQQGGCEKFTERQPCAVDRFEGAGFSYLAGNVVDEADATVFPEVTRRSFDGVELGFIGLTLKDTAMLVSPSATAGYRFLDEAETANRLARDLREDGADAVILLIHEGGWSDPGFNVSGCPNLTGALLPILDRLDPAIDVVVSGHTHNAYSCEMELPDGGKRLLTSAGRYGTFATDIRLSIDPLRDEVSVIQAVNVPIAEGEGEDPDIAEIVHRYVQAAEPYAARVVGEIALAGQQDRPCLDDPAENLVADAQLAKARSVMEGVDMAFINSGGVRTDLSSAEDGIMTYGEIFAMQPFGNSLLILEMSGAEIDAVLEQQFCREEGVEVCYSTLTPSANLSYRIDPNGGPGQRVEDMILSGKALEAEELYQVAVNNFVAKGGDGFSVFAQARVIGDAGLDVDALEMFLANGARVPSCGRIQFLGVD